MDYPFTTKANSATHNYPCQKCGKPTRHGDYCQKCRDKNNKDLDKLLTDTARSEGDLDTYKATLSRLQLEMRRAETSIHELENQIFLNKLNTKFDDELVSDDHRYNYGKDQDGINWTLETHCTIIRFKDSPEDVYFGHVTLKIYNDVESAEVYTWRYGAKVTGDIPKNLNHKFWFIKNDPRSTKVSKFANFDDISSETLLSDIMKDHLDKCSKFFKEKSEKKKIWENQVWYPTDLIGKEKATDVLERIKKIKEERNKDATGSVFMQEIKEAKKQTLKLEQDLLKEARTRRKANIAKRKEDSEKRPSAEKREDSEKRPSAEKREDSKKIPSAEKREDSERAVDVDVQPNPEQIEQQRLENIKINKAVAKANNFVITAKNAADRADAAAQTANANDAVAASHAAAAQTADPKDSKAAMSAKRAAASRVVNAANVAAESAESARDAARATADDVRDAIDAANAAANAASLADADSAVNAAKAAADSAVNNANRADKAAATAADAAVRAAAATAVDDSVATAVDDSVATAVDDSASVDTRVRTKKVKTKEVNEDTLILEELKKESIKYVKNFLEKINIQEINISENELPKSVDERNSLIQKFDGLIIYITNSMKPTDPLTYHLKVSGDKPEKIFNILKNQLEKLIKYKSALSRTNILEEIQTFEGNYNNFISVLEEKLSNTLDATEDRSALNSRQKKILEKLIIFYTIKYQPKIDKWLHDSTELNTQDTQRINSRIVKLKEHISSEKKLIWIDIFKYLYKLSHTYTKDVIPKEKLLETDLNYEKANDDIQYLIEFYEEYIQKLSSLKKPKKTDNEKKVKVRNEMLKFKAGVNPEKRLQELTILTVLKTIVEKEKLLETLYRQEEQAINIIKDLIGFYTQWIQLYDLNKEDSSIIYPIKMPYPDTKRRLEDLYMMIDRNIEGKGKEIKEFLIQDSLDLVKSFEEEESKIKSELLSENNPMTLKAQTLRERIYSICVKYITYIDNLGNEIVKTLEDSKGKESVINSLLEQREKLINYQKDLVSNDFAYRKLKEFESYYSNFIYSQMKIFEPDNKVNPTSLIAYYRTYTDNLDNITKRIKDLQHTDYIQKHIQEFIKHVNPNEMLKYLLQFEEKQTPIDRKLPVLSDSSQLITYYTGAPITNEDIDTIIANFIIIFPTNTYEQAKDYVIHVKDLRSNMYNEKNFSTASILKYYGYITDDLLPN